MTQLDLVSPNRFSVIEDPEQEEAKMPDLDTAEPEEIAQDECLSNKAEEGVVKSLRARRVIWPIEARIWKRGLILGQLWQ